MYLPTFLPRVSNDSRYIIRAGQTDVFDFELKGDCSASFFYKEKVVSKHTQDSAEYFSGVLRPLSVREITVTIKILRVFIQSRKYYILGQKKT